MSIVFLFGAAVFLMVLGHSLKVRRWGILISVYEEPCISNLLYALASGHIINTIIPFRLGDIIRVLVAGRKMKNGYSFSLATVIVDLYVDLITVGIFFCGLSWIGKGGERLLYIARFYMCILLVIVLLTLISVFIKKQIKRGILSISAIFNNNIEFRLLYISYLCIASFKDIIKNISKSKFMLYTVGIWGSYASSYIIFAEIVQRLGFDYSTSDIFGELFSGFNIYQYNQKLIWLWLMYLVLPLIVCFFLAIGKKNPQKEIAYRLILPQMNQSDRKAFLKTYYEEDNRNYIQTYLEVNKDVTVLEDNSAGSNASTLLVMKLDGVILYRKYAFDKDAIKLREQIQWIEDHQADLPLPIIVEKRQEKNYVMYDMRNYRSAVGFFKYIHTTTIENSWNILETVLEQIQSRLYSKNIHKSDEKTIIQYIDSKVNKNIKIIKEQDKYIKDLEQYDNLVVNGLNLRPLRAYSDMLSAEHLKEIFIQDAYTDIHGDLTIENIICLSEPDEVDLEEYKNKERPRLYYLIDPNTGNLHDSPFLDYGKLLQSLHGNYEFLMLVNSIKIEGNRINYFVARSDAYEKLYEKFTEYLWKQFNKEQILSIYYHEVIHWLRLLPYKISKNEKKAVVFYTGLLSVLNDVWEIEHDKKK